MKSESEIEHEIAQIKASREQKERLETTLRRAESIIRECLFEAKDVVNLARKFGLDRYMDKELEVYGKASISVKLDGKLILTGRITPKSGGWHVVADISKSDVLKRNLKSKLSTVRKQLERRVSQMNQAKLIAEEEKTILNREQIKKQLGKDVDSLKNKLKALGAA
jgi:hypothetical protein